jgi:PAS domain S-box-containing protein
MQFFARSKMSFPNPFMNLPALEQVIDRSPMMVPPETPLVDAISLMSQAPGRHCGLSDTNLSMHTDLQGQIYSSCVLVMDGLRLVGILTERDMVKLAAAEMSLTALRVTDAMTRQVITMTLSASATTLSALALFQQYRIRHLPVLDDQGQLVGIITPNNIRQVLQPMNLLRLRKVAEVMTPSVIHAFGTAPVLDIARQMAEHRVSCVVIVESGPAIPEASKEDLPLNPVGIITERDIVQFQALELNLAQIPAQTVMSTPLCCLNPSDSLWAAHQEMQARYVHRLVVAGDQGELIGIVTQTSLLQFLDPLEMTSIIETLQQEVDHRTDELMQVNRHLQQEITGHQQTEVLLRESQSKLAGMLDHAFEFMGLLTPDGILLEANQTSLNYAGVCKADVIGRPFWELSWWTHSSESQATLRTAIAQAAEGEFVRCEVTHLGVTGRLDTFDFSITPVKDEAGNVIFLIPEGRDISDRKQMELQLLATRDQLESQLEHQTFELTVANTCLRQESSDYKQAEEKICEQAALIDISPDAIMVRDLDCRILFWNKGAEQIYAWTAAEILGRDSCDLLSPKSLPQFENALQNIRESGEWRGELQKVTKSGQEIQVSSRWKLLRDATGQPHAILTVETDITEQKQLEAQFLRTQRLESLGILASGIAHDMNNILAPMLASAQLLPILNPTLDEQSQQLLTIFEDNARRGTELVKQILAFARGLEGERIALQVKHILTELEKTIVSTFPKSIQIVHSFPKQDLWLISANATQLHQVFMNFCVNARDAMPNGGILSIVAENRVIDKTYVRMNLDAKVGSYIVITFGDTGAGIAPEHIDRIFEPFFTTKAIDEGTGLGLSTVMGIVKNHGGFVTVSSEVGKGTQFEVFLPTVEATETTSEEIQESFQGQGELILVVDDEANIRETLKLTLEAQNYQVVLAANGIEAIAVYVQHQDKIKVVLIDMIMPTMGGATAIQTLQQFNPPVKIIACSGLPFSNKLLKTDSIKAFLPKPFTSRDLLNTVHGVLKDE